MSNGRCVSVCAGVVLFDRRQVTDIPEYDSSTWPYHLLSWPSSTGQLSGHHNCLAFAYMFLYLRISFTAESALSECNQAKCTLDCKPS